MTNSFVTLVINEKKKFKPLKYFFLAANSLLAAGLLVHNNQDLSDWIFLIWSTYTGIFLTYRFNDFIDANENLDFDWKAFISVKIHLLVILQFAFLLVPLSLYYISPFQFTTLGIAGFLGFLYSLKFQIRNTEVRLKHIFFLKNFLIGICWGILPLIGSDDFSKNTSIALFILASIQVFIGSTVRDFTDIAQDTKEYVRSLPIVLGKRNTLVVLHLLNLISMLIYIYIVSFGVYSIPAILTFAWRILILNAVNKDHNNTFWSQKMNLLTCFIIFLGQFITWTLT